MKTTLPWKGREKSAISLTPIILAFILIVMSSAVKAQVLPRDNCGDPVGHRRVAQHSVHGLIVPGWNGSADRGECGSGRGAADRGQPRDAELRRIPRRRQGLTPGLSVYGAKFCV